MKISIIGSGNAGCAHACILSASGHAVTLVKTSFSIHDENFETISGKKTMFYTLPGETSFRTSNIHRVTRDLQSGVADADVIFVMTQSLQHEKIANQIGPYLNDPKLIIVIPGYLSSLFFKPFVDIERTILCEGESTPYDSRITKPGYISILFKNIRNSIGVLQKGKTEKAVQIMKSLINTYQYNRSNIVESAMHNPNLIVHTIGTIMSASRIEYSKGEFWMYLEGFTPSIWNIIEDLDNEKNRVIKAFNGRESAYVDECKFRNEESLQKDSMAVFKSYASEGSPKGPGSLDTRFIYEDVPNGLCLLEDLSLRLGFECPITSSLISLANAIHRTNYRKNARTLEKLSLSINELKEIVK